MIKNEREYRITKAQAEKFEHALADLTIAPPGTDAELRKVQAAALRSQLDELQEALREYEALQQGHLGHLSIRDLDDVSRALIQARIALGLTQKDLANRLRLKEQQVQRYEATDYAGASLKRLREVSDALNLRLEGQVSLPGGVPSLKDLFLRLREAGIERKFVVDRVLPSALAAELEELGPIQDNRRLVAQVISVLNRVYGWTRDAITSGTPLRVDPAIAGAARFKSPRNTDRAHFVAFCAYAHSIALSTLRATETLTSQPVPTDPRVVRQAIIASYGEVTFESTLRYVWQLGIPVLPLKDPGVFHGATWRRAGRNIVVLKQRSSSIARWLNDLLHELRHAGEEPELAERTVVEESDPLERHGDNAEAIATEFASDVVLAGRAEELAHACAEAASRHVPRLKKVVPEIAGRESVPADALANYVAYRLSLEGTTNWWGAAANLQVTDPDPWRTARGIFFEYASFERLDRVERDLLARALSE